MSAWLTFEVLLLYVIVVASLTLSLLAVFFAYRLSRITGLFSAWALLIAGLALVAFEDFAYFGSVIFVGYSRVVTVVEGYTWQSFLFVWLILVAIPLLFFASMYRLHSIFRANKVAQDAEAAGR